MKSILAKRLKNDKGITLTALVIITVILITLSVIGVNVILGENDLIFTAKKSGNIDKQEIENKNSFIAGTKVITPKGLINIEDIKVGDKVYTKNIETNEIEVEDVLKTLNHDYDEDLIEIHTKNAEVVVTVNHKFYVENKGWIEAKKLLEGDILVTNNNVGQKITRIRNIDNKKTIKVYNLSVKENHNYFVGIDGVLVHNCCVAPGSQILVDLEGNTKVVESLKVGDTIVAYNEKTGKNELTKVIETYTHRDANDIVTIRFKDGSTLVQNMYHPIYTKEGWKSLTRYKGYEYLENDDVVKTENGWKEIETIDINLMSSPRDLFIVDVEGLDNFYANGTMVHDLKF